MSNTWRRLFLRGRHCHRHSLRRPGLDYLPGQRTARLVQPYGECEMTTLKSFADTVAVERRSLADTDQRRRAVVPDGDRPGSSKYRLLPAIYSADRFAGRFLRMFQDVLDPVAVIVDNQPYYFDPMTAPLALLDWIAFWVDLDEGRAGPCRRSAPSSPPLLPSTECEAPEDQAAPGHLFGRPAARHGAHQWFPPR